MSTSTSTTTASMPISAPDLTLASIRPPVDFPGRWAKATGVPAPGSLWGGARAGRPGIRNAGPSVRRGNPGRLDWPNLNGPIRLTVW